MSKDRPEPQVWRRADMLAALVARDIAGVYQLLQRVGISQRRLAALTGQSQSEISEILGGRKVVSYDVLVRIADGLGVPRGHLGLAYDDTSAGLVAVPPPTQDPRSGRWVVRLPVLVDTYGAAVQLAESVTATLAALAVTRPIEDQPVNAPDRAWHQEAGTLLAAWG